MFSGQRAFQNAQDWLLLAAEFADPVSICIAEHSIFVNALLCSQGIQRKRPSEVQSALLRRHLLELTQSFIIPLVSWAGTRQGGVKAKGGSGMLAEVTSWRLLSLIRLY